MDFNSFSYTITASCHNCGWRGQRTISRGQLVSQSDCPQCGCTTLSRYQSLIEKRYGDYYKADTNSRWQEKLMQTKGGGGPGGMGGAGCA